MIKTWDSISSDLTNYTYCCGKTRVCTKIAAIFQNGRHFGEMAEKFVGPRDF